MGHYFTLASNRVLFNLESHCLDSLLLAMSISSTQTRVTAPNHSLEIHQQSSRSMR